MANDYDEEFGNYLSMAKALVTGIHDKSDIKICSRWIQKLCNLQSDDVSVKKNRNAFFRYLLQILAKEVKEIKSREQTSGSPMDGAEAAKDVQYNPFACHWSPDRRTYVACQPIPGRGALVYMAVSDDPALGWDIPGKKKPKPPIK